MKMTKPFSSQEGLSDNQEGFDWSEGLRMLRSAWWVGGSLSICLQAPFYLFLQLGDWQGEGEGVFVFCIAWRVLLLFRQDHGMVTVPFLAASSHHVCISLTPSSS